MIATDALVQHADGFSSVSHSQAVSLRSSFQRTEIFLLFPDMDRASAESMARNILNANRVTGANEIFTIEDDNLLPGVHYQLGDRLDYAEGVGYPVNLSGRVVSTTLQMDEEGHPITHVELGDTSWTSPEQKLANASAQLLYGLAGGSVRGRPQKL